MRVDFRTGLLVGLGATLTIGLHCLWLYADQWGNDRALVLERMRLVFGYGRHLRLHVIDANCSIDNGVGLWRGRIAIDSDDAELVAVLKERVNSLTTPFELQWRHVSRKPWDWKLVRVGNTQLDIPAGFD